MPKYPNIKVRLFGTNYNAYYVLGTVANLLRCDGVSPKTVNKFYREATSGDYNNLLRVCMGWVSVS